MIFTTRQNDALTELINIAFARTGASLSELSGHRVLLDAPTVGVFPMEELPAVLQTFLPGEVASVHQIFTGPVAGDALLLMNYDGAVTLTELLAEEPHHMARLDASGREMVTEIGNILLNACLGTFGNLLKVQVTFSLPRLHLECLDGLMRSITVGSHELRYAVVASTAFRVLDGAVTGYLVIVLGVASLDRLIKAVEEWENRQLGSAY
jgi:chemotaxis protein CheC